MRARAAGFTLLELLIVLAIFGVFALMAYGGLDSVLNTRRRIDDALDHTAAYQKAYMRLRNDFQQVRNRVTRDGYGDAQPALRTDISSGKVRVEFTRGGWRNPLYQPRPSLERVSYRVDDHKLLRESFRVLDQAQDSAPVKLEVLDGVEEAKWKFLDGQGQWREQWPDVNAQGQVDAPVAVEVTLDTKELGALRFVFRIGLDPVKIIASAQGVGGQTGVNGHTTGPQCEKGDEECLRNAAGGGSGDDDTDDGAGGGGAGGGNPQPPEPPEDPGNE